VPHNGCFRFAIFGQYLVHARRVAHHCSLLRCTTVTGRMRRREEDPLFTHRIPLVRAAAAASMRVTLRSGGREGGEASSRELRVHMLITRGTTQLIAIGTIAQEAHIAHIRPMYNRIGDDAGGRPLVRRVARATKYAKASRHAAFVYGHGTVHRQAHRIRPHALRSMSISGAINSGSVISTLLTVTNHIHPSARSGCRALL